MKFLALRSMHLLVLSCLASAVAATALEAQTKPAAAKTNTSTNTSAGTSSGAMTQNVNVVNTPTVNVGTLPAVNVNSLPAVSLLGTPAVTITGTPTVNVGTPTVNLGAGSTVGINGSVQVGNVATSPVFMRDVDNPARQPFQQLLCLAATASSCSVPSSFTVPSGKELVIEYVSGGCVTADASSFVNAAGLHTSVQGAVGFHFFGNLRIGPNSAFDFGQQTRLYADPNTNVTLAASLIGGGGVCGMEISGYLVNLP